MTEDGLPPLREVISRYGLSAKRSLGQNFLFDLNLTRRIARAAGPLDGFTIVEVGPGPGGLTRALLAEGAPKVIAVERDMRILPALADIASAYPERLDIRHADALTFDWASQVPQPAKVVANLPYNVATQLLIAWLADPWPPWFASLTLMFQKEVADRITASPGSKTYGRLSVLAQWRCSVKSLFNINPSAFTPAPEVTSAVVQLVPHRECTPTCRLATLERVTAAAFGQRRKMLRSSLKLLGVDISALLARAGLEGERRAEEIAVTDFARLAQLLDSDAGSPIRETSPDGARNR